MNSKYDNYGNDSNESSTNNNANSSSGGDRERDPEIKLDPYATVRGSLDFAYGTQNKYGQSLGIRFADGHLIDGVLMRKVDDPLKHKLFNWQDLPITTDEPTADDAPEVHAVQGRKGTIKYELVAARVEGDEDEGRDADPAEPIPIGDFMVWESGGNAPSASAKVLAQLVTSLGRDAVYRDDEGEVVKDIFNWLKVQDEQGNYLIELRDDLKGREVDLFKIVLQGDNYPFYRPIMVDTKTGKELVIGGQTPTEGDAAEPEAEAPAATDGGAVAAAEPAPAASNTDSVEEPEPVADFIEFCVDFDLSDDSQILDNLYQMVESDNNDLSSEMVEQVGGEEVILRRIHDEL